MFANICVVYRVTLWWDISDVIAQHLIDNNSLHINGVLIDNW